MGMALEEMGQLLYVMHRAFGFGFFNHLPAVLTFVSEDSDKLQVARLPVFL